MRTVTINGQKVSTHQEPEDWYYYRTDAFQRLRASTAAIDDLRALVDHVIGVAAYAIIGGSPWDEKTEEALETAKTAIMDGLIDKSLQKSSSSTDISESSSLTNVERRQILKSLLIISVI
jgi:hypothetical protein